MQIGDINVVESIVNLELRVQILERALDFISRNNSNLKLPSQSDIDKFGNDALSELQRLYPNSGITKI